MTFQHKKKFGQNFLTSPIHQDKLKNAVARHYNPNLPMVEIGPGAGDLTQHIAQYNPLLIEIDEEACQLLQSKFSGLTILHGDALRMLTAHSPKIPKDFYLFSNLPYNVGSRILMELGQQYPQTPFTVILQAEVAHKTRTSEHFTFFGAWLNYVWDTKVLFGISKGNFTPAPRVDSAALQGTPKARDAASLPIKFSILKKLFALPKKTLSNNLKQLGWDSVQVEVFLTAHNLPPNTRLNWDNYAQILDQLYKQV